MGKMAGNESVDARMQIWTQDVDSEMDNEMDGTRGREIDNFFVGRWRIAEGGIIDGRGAAACANRISRAT